MDRLTFVATVIEHTVWPVCVIALAFLYRRPIEQLLPWLRTLKVDRGAVEVEFNRPDDRIKSIEAEIVEYEGVPNLPEVSAPKEIESKVQSAIAFEDAVLRKLQTEVFVAPHIQLSKNALIKDGPIRVTADAVFDAGFSSYIVEIKSGTNPTLLFAAEQQLSRACRLYGEYLNQIGMRKFVKPLLVVPAEMTSSNELNHIPILRFDQASDTFVNLSEVKSSLGNLMTAYRTF